MFLLGENRGVIGGNNNNITKKSDLRERERVEYIIYGDEREYGRPKWSKKQRE